MYQIRNYNIKDLFHHHQNACKQVKRGRQESFTFHITTQISSNMLVKSFLAQGAAVASSSAFAGKLSSLGGCDALVLLSLGVEHEYLVDAVHQVGIDCPVFLSETYGILGTDIDTGESIELMEKGRGSEYGYCGGSGGQGCVAVGYSQGVQTGYNADDFPLPNASTLMVIADQSGAWAQDRESAPLHYGGITKSTWRLDPATKRLAPVPYFWVGDISGEPTGVSTFTDDAQEATTTLLAKIPSGYVASGSIGLFPCFTRGVNQYGKEHVEPQAAEKAMLKTATPAQVYGMFAHGELGPTSFGDFIRDPNTIPCTQHSMTTILSIHTIPQ